MFNIRLPIVHRMPVIAAILLVTAFVAAACTSVSEPTPTLKPVSPEPSTSNGTAPASLTQPTTITILPPVTQVVQDVRPAVVSIAAETQSRDFFGRLVRGISTGTGVIFDPQGYLVTNFHVIEGASKVEVTLADDRTFIATVIGTDPETDLAVLEIGSGAESFPFASLADPDNIQVGEWVIAIGNALALQGGPSVTVGIVGALDRILSLGGQTFYNLIQTDAAINQGNSGGPLLNLNGEVVGINSITLTEAQGIGFAISTFTVIPVIDSILEHGRVVWPWVGVELDDITPGKALELNLPVRSGVLIEGVVRNSPADRASIRPSDIVRSFGGQEIGTVRELIIAIRQDYEVGDKVEVVLLRDGKEITLEVILGERPRS